MNNQITFAGAIKKAFTSWRLYRGVASRREYWLFYLFTVLVGLVTNTIDKVIEAGNDYPSVLNLNLFAQLALLVVVLPLTARRFRDAGLSAWWLVAQLVPVALAIAKMPQIVALLSRPELTDSKLIDKMSDAQLQAFALSALDAFGLIALTGFAVGVFQLIVTLLPTKPSWRGNKYAPITTPEPVWGYAVAGNFVPVQPQKPNEDATSTDDSKQN